MSLLPAPYTPDTYVPSLNGKVIIITGADGGSGYETIIHVARYSPSKLVPCARSKEKYDNTLEGIVVADPGPEAAKAFIADNDRSDVLMNNAGIMTQPAALTKNGFEVQFGTNHIGHALCTKLLLPLLTETATEPDLDVRIVYISSDVHMLAPWSAGFLPEECLTGTSSHPTWTGYGQSKLTKILFTTELARRHPKITSVEIHPGGVATSLLDPFKQNHPYITMLANPLWQLFAPPSSKGAWKQAWASQG